MNQSIIFSDNEQYNKNLQQIEFKAQHQGTLINCIISVKDLCKINGQKTNERSELLALFETFRFDLEELAEQMINEQAFAQDGNIYITKVLTNDD